MTTEPTHVRNCSFFGGTLQQSILPYTPFLAIERSCCLLLTMAFATVLSFSFLRRCFLLEQFSTLVWPLLPLDTSHDSCIFERFDSSTSACVLSWLLISVIVAIKMVREAIKTRDTQNICYLPKGVNKARVK